MALVLVTAATLALLVPAAARPTTVGAAQAGVLRGEVPLRGMNVVLLAARPGGTRPTVLGATRSRPGGGFAIHYRRSASGAVKYLLATRPGGAAEAGYPVPANAYRLAAALGEGSVPGRATVNERTTVAIGYAMAQFLRGSRVAGKNPGLINAAAMSRNLVGRRSGRLSPVLNSFPNGRSTSTLATFNSLANLLAVCRQQGRRCAQLLQLAAVPGGGAAGDTLAAVAALAQNPWHNARRLFALSRTVPAVYRPALERKQRPDAWTLALRFEGRPETMDGPGAFAIDGGGNLWVANNYEYSRERLFPVCAAENVLRFTPTGQAFPGSPYTGGGLSGAGFGISIDPQNHVWVGNFGFAAPECERQPPHNSVSEFTLAGKPLSPPLEEFPPKSKRFRGGYENGDISWPQATIPDRRGNIWIANCGNNSVTKYTQGNHEAATNLGEGLIGLKKPFGAAVNGKGRIFVTGNENSRVAILKPNGLPTANSPVHGGGLHRPMGIAIDSGGYAWVANSGKIAAPCPVKPNVIPGKGSAVLLKPNGELARRNPIKGAGMSTPWGIAVDGDDHVWVANFTGRRLSELCGTRPERCPAGKQRVGASISPRKNGYHFDGLVRNTGVAIDPSGNVWLTNNWKIASIRANPGGYQIVAFLGLAAPVKTPAIGPPQQP